MPTVHKNLCQNGHVWVTMVIEHALFCLSLQSGPLVGLQRLTAVRGCGSVLGFLTKCPNYSINTPNVAKHPVCRATTGPARSAGWPSVFLKRAAYQSQGTTLLPSPLFRELPRPEPVTHSRPRAWHGRPAPPTDTSQTLRHPHDLRAIRPLRCRVAWSSDRVCKHTRPATWLKTSNNRNAKQRKTHHDGGDQATDWLVGTGEL